MLNIVIPNINKNTGGYAFRLEKASPNLSGRAKLKREPMAPFLIWYD